MHFKNIVLLGKVEEFDGRIINELISLPEDTAISVLNEFSACDRSAVRNPLGFIMGIINRVQRSGLFQLKYFTLIIRILKELLNSMCIRSDDEFIFYGIQCQYFSCSILSLDNSF